ncbi:MAG: glycerol-3-phosphate 1-O-acyltransferase PlsY [Clostridiales bacterium]|nr:glycerol-3-phosphate 1-O-acyltransferase PlsY [Clostridiales bacterium]
MVRVYCLIIGYIFGLFQSGYIYGKMNGIDIRTKGSGNSGTTNALRVLGKKAGFVVFIGDVLKLFLACYLTTQLLNQGHFYNEIGQLLLLYTGFGVVLGHNFPFYLHFKGGKGIACTAAMLLVLDWRLAMVELVIFVATVLLSHYVSLGSIFVVIAFFIGWILFGHFGLLSLDPSYFTESCIMILLWALLAIFRHRSNLKRLAHGEENKLF